MTTQTLILRMLARSRWLAYFNTPLQRNGLALVLSLASTSGLGLIYWALAARSYSPEDVGINSAVISAMMFLGNLSQFGLVNFLNRFLPKAGRASARFIIGSYLVSAVVGLVSSLIFVMGVSLWSPALGFLRFDPQMFAWFVAATILWCIFAIQDGALVGLRRASWVPAENIIFALSKIGLLLLFARTFVGFGIFASWTFPLIFQVLVINGLIFGMVIPKHVRETERQAEHFGFSDVARFVLGDYFSTLIWMATVNLMPIIVLEMIGASANAFFYLPWMITYSLYMVSRNMGMSLTVEASKDQSKLVEFSYRSLLQTALLLIPAVGLIIAIAPLILQLFGSGYAAEGSQLLRLLAISAIPNIITSQYVSIARVRRRVLDIVLTLGAVCVIVLLLTFLLIGTYGLPGVGIAWLIGQTLVAGVLTFTKLRKMLITVPLRIIRNRLIGTVQRIRFMFFKRRVLSVLNGAMPEIVQSLPKRLTQDSPANWQVQEVFFTLSDMIVAGLSPIGADSKVIINLAQSEYALAQMDAQLRVLSHLQSEARLGDWRQLLPELIDQGQIGEDPYWIFEHLPGTQADIVHEESQNRDSLLRAAAEAILALHQATATQTAIDDKILATWVHEPIRVIANSTLRYAVGDGNRILQALGQELDHRLSGRQMVLSWTHGDYWPKNILVSPDGSRVIGIVDWDQAKPEDLPYLDLVSYILSTRRLQENRELGEILVDVFREERWRPAEQELWDREAVVLGGSVPSIWETLTLFWLRHVSSNLMKSRRYSYSPIWVINNYLKVLRALRQGADVQG